MIHGKLVGLRAVEKADLDMLKEWRNIPEFRKNFREIRELSYEHQVNWFQKSCIDNPNDFMFVIMDLNEKQAIGAAGLLYVDWVIRSADFSFYIGRDNAYIDSEGYAKEAADLLVKYAFNDLNLNKVWMELYEYDKMKLDFFMDECRFTKDGILRDNCFSEGKYFNSYILSLLKNDLLQP